MYDIPEDCLLTYDPEYLDFHSDTTDFEDTQIQRVTNKNGNHSLISKSNKKTSKYCVSVNPLNKTNIPNIKVSKHSSKEMWASETVYNQEGGELRERKSYLNKKYRIALDSGDQIETINSKRSLIRHKVIPCISGIFKRSCNTGKRMSTVNETNVSQDDGCQTYRVSHQPQMRQLDRRQQCYVTQPVREPGRKVQPVHECGRNTHNIPPTKYGHKQQLTQKIHRHEFANTQYSLTSSSDPDHIEALKKKDKGWKWKKPVDHNIVKSYVDSYLERHMQEKQTRNPSKRRKKFPFQVYANPCTYSSKKAPNSGKGSTDIGSTTSAVPSTCSGFWDYLFNKINSKYQTPRPEYFKPCDCRHSNIKINYRPLKKCSPKACSVHPCAIYPCSPNPCPPGTCSAELCVPQSTPNDNKADEKPSKPATCACNPKHRSDKSVNPQPSLMGSIFPKEEPFPKQEGSPACVGSPLSTPAPLKLTPCASPKSPSTKPKKVDCQCSPKQSKTQDGVKPCQVPHDCMANTMSQKYNGEILCIHNPPCVLINGCLNLPYPKPEPVATVWPMVECHRASFQHLFRKKTQKKYIEESSQYQAVEQGCQYQPTEQYQYRLLEQGCQYQVIDQCCQYQVPSTEKYDITDRSCQYYPETVNAYQLTDHKKEKNIQSSCNHKPPCEVKRTCHRPKYDPKLQSSCIHVPMCDNLPLCVLESSSTDIGPLKKTCRHKPKCAEVPVCRKNYYIDIPAPAKEEIGTQVRPRSKMICRHDPPCLMVPRCIDRLCADSCCQYGAVPDCVHQPMCEMIPACCRKSAKEMVSVCSQHPNSCRIV